MRDYLNFDACTLFIISSLFLLLVCANKANMAWQPVHKEQEREKKKEKVLVRHSRCHKLWRTFFCSLVINFAFFLTTSINLFSVSICAFLKRCKLFFVVFESLMRWESYAEIYFMHKLSFTKREYFFPFWENKTWTYAKWCPEGTPEMY